LSSFFEDDDDFLDKSVSTTVDTIVHRVTQCVEKINNNLVACESIYRVGYFPKVMNFYTLIGLIDGTTCQGGVPSEIGDKIPIGVFFIYDMNTDSSTVFLDEHNNIQNVEKMKSATDVWYNYKINVVDFLYGCTNISCRQRGFSTLTRVPIVLCLIEDNFGHNLGVKGIVNHATTFGDGMMISVNCINMPASQLVLCKKLNFFSDDEVLHNVGPKTWISHISNVFLTDEQNYVKVLQNRLFTTFLDSTEEKHYIKNFFKTCVGYNTFLMLGEDVSLDTLPLLKNTIDEITDCTKKDLLISPCSQKGEGGSDKKGGKKKSKIKNSDRKSLKKSHNKKRKSHNKKRKSHNKKRKSHKKIRKSSL